MSSERESKKRKQSSTMTRVERVIGVTEEELVKQTNRQQYICKQVGSETLHFVNVQTGDLTPIGDFSTPTLKELQDQLVKEKKETKPCQFHCLYGIDIGELQTRLETHSLVQIAGNFNCLNVSNRRRRPDDGRMVELAHQQTTQGPAATFGPLASHLYRVHFSLPPNYPGQTLDHQINLLDNVTDYTGVPVNGKLTLTGTERTIPNADDDIDLIAQQVRVGLQTDCHVMYGRNQQNREVCLLDQNDGDFSKLPKIDQCHVAVTNWNSLTRDHTKRHVPDWIKGKKEEIFTLSRMLLRAAYEGVYLVALTRGTEHLYLTLVGGGVFGNPNPLIVQELARAHKKWATHSASRLKSVSLCAYSPQDNVEDLLKQEGIEIAAGADSK